MEGLPEDSAVVSAQRNDPPISLRTAPIQVRRRRATVSSRPASPPPGIVPSTSDSPLAAYQGPSSPTDSPVDQNTNLGTFPRVTRRRGATITERLFSGDVYQGIGEDSGRTTRARAGTDAITRGRIGSVSSANSGGLRGRLGLGSDRGSTAGSELHADEEIDLLDVLDDSIATTAHLTNIQSAFFPSFLTRPPVCELPLASDEEALPLQDLSTSTTGAKKPLAEVKEEEEEDEEEDPLDAHLRKVIRKQKRKEKIKEGLKGVWAFLKTPLGIFFGIYGFLVVFWGAGLVFVLIIPFQDAYTKGLWIEIASQVLTALFTITGIGMFPSRLIDTYYIGIIYSLARRTRERRVKFGLSSLRDRNDLPDPEPVLPGGILTSALGKEGGDLGRVEREIGTTCDGSKTEEIVLTEGEFARLHHAQMKFAASQTWYRPHESPTHHAFPISSALVIAILFDLNSVFQALLCGVMWGIKGIPPNERPAWTTATFIVGSFGCGLAAAILIGHKSEKTKKKKEVTRKVWALLKADEIALETRRKAALEARAREKKERKERKERERGGHGSNGGGGIAACVRKEYVG